MTATTTRARRASWRDGAPSSRAVGYLTDLTRDRQVIPGESAVDSLAKLTRWLSRGATAGDVSDAIDRNKSKPRRSAPVYAAPAAVARPARMPFPAVPEHVLNSRYAILSAPLESIPDAWKRQEYLFFEVKKLNGRRTIRRLEGNWGGYTRRPMTAELATELFAYLEDEEKAERASTLYGEINQCCGTCAAPLTDDTSLERKQGPICWKRWEARRAARAAV